jgi:hypothetical protein
MDDADQLWDTLVDAIRANYDGYDSDKKIQDYSDEITAMMGDMDSEQIARAELINNFIAEVKQNA